MAESTAEAKKEKDALEKKKMQIEGTMAKLKEFTASQIESMNQVMSKTGERNCPQTGKWESKEFRASQGRKNHSAVTPRPQKV